MMPSARTVEMALCLARGAVSYHLPDAHVRLDEARARVARARSTVLTPDGYRICPECGGYEQCCRWCAAADRVIACLPQWEADLRRLEATLEEGGHER